MSANQLSCVYAAVAMMQQYLRAVTNRTGQPVQSGHRSTASTLALNLPDADNVVTLFADGPAMITTGSRDAGQAYRSTDRRAKRKGNPARTDHAKMPAPLVATGRLMSATSNSSIYRGVTRHRCGDTGSEKQHVRACVRLDLASSLSSITSTAGAFQPRGSRSDALFERNTVHRISAKWGYTRLPLSGCKIRLIPETSVLAVLRMKPFTHLAAATMAFANPGLPPPPGADGLPLSCGVSLHSCACFPPPQAHQAVGGAHMGGQEAGVPGRVRRRGTGGRRARHHGNQVPRQTCGPPLRQTLPTRTLLLTCVFEVSRACADARSCICCNGTV
jgi:hypothetical protein